VFQQYDCVEVGVQQLAIAATVARYTHELGTDLFQINVGAELLSPTVGEAVVDRRTSVVVPAAVSGRRRSLDCLIITEIQIVVVVQRQSRSVDT